MTFDLFLSYARIKDSYNGVSKFKEHLEWSLRLQSGNTEFSIFQDRNDILVGENFSTVIENELSGSKALIILYSPTWINSSYCRKEYIFFKSVNPTRPIIVLQWGAVNIGNLPNEDSIEIHKEIAELNHFKWDINLQYGQWQTPKLKIETDKLSSKILELLNKGKSNF